MSGADTLATWLRLARCPDVGTITALRLLQTFGSAEAIFSAAPATLTELGGPQIAQALLAPPGKELLELIDRTRAWLAQPENHLLTLADEAYPKQLLEIPDPPLLLYAKGSLPALTAPSIAIVGSRNASAQGMANARQFAQALAEAGLVVVSGMALGIDTAAHEGALLAQGLLAASTIAVIGTGIDIVYPARNRALAHRIAEHGCIVSEYPLGMPALPANFPRRNRIISGLARGTLVVEAAAQSGSLITARQAADQGRDVYAIPGSIHSPLAKGCHELIRQGAKLVESAQDILEDWKNMHFPCVLEEKPAQPTSSDHPDNDLLRIIGYDPVSLNVLAARAGLDASTINAQLLMLELDGCIERLAGGMVRRLG
ncbi:DNA-processing protein DprA [Noviherbaspirillum pedocola]|uniref:DNA-protecting protein DprA n=1 Tax=Noviherbaspirillum pedocola TaxID=2801341 RepID=A0A934SV69_9BURK|nr:DNA-processing protein DprA [Noviherbaspirillum pedocola]MBK4737175.1 DNA-protecting protein DprA [Noviherbaspirillum pedocola]